MCNADLMCLDSKSSTTRLLTQEKPTIENGEDDNFQNVLFLPKGEDRNGEGGLRTQGYFKKSLEDKPLITVVMAVFNGEETLETAIKSIVEQSYENVEFIVIDGGSSDATLAIIKQYQHAIDYWVSEPDGGIYDAFNKAVRTAQGEYYIVVGCDDVLFEKSIEHLVDDVLIKGNVDYVIASLFVGERLKKGMRPSRAWLGAGAMVNSHSVGMAMRVSVHHVVGLYSTRYILNSDALFIKKIFSADELVGCSSDVVMGRFSLDGASNNNLALGLSDGFLIQLETGENKVFQVFLFIARLLKNIYRI